MPDLKHRRFQAGVYCLVLLRRVARLSVILLLLAISACGQQGDGQASSLPIQSTESPKVRPTIISIPTNWPEGTVTAAKLSNDGTIALGLSTGFMAIGKADIVGDDWRPDKQFALPGEGPVENIASASIVNQFAVSQGNGNIYALNLNNPSESRWWKHLDGLGKLVMGISPDGRYLAAGGLGEIVLDTTSGAVVLKPDQIISTPTSYSFSPDSNQVLEVNAGGFGITHVLTHPVDAAQPSNDIEMTDCGDSIATQIAPNFFICATADGQILTYLLPSAVRQYAFVSATTTPITAVASTRDQSLTIGGLSSGEVIAWRGKNTKEDLRTDTLGASISGLDLSADGRYVLVKLSSEPGEITGLRLLKF
jgi:hypothetical protein